MGTISFAIIFVLFLLLLYKLEFSGKIVFDNALSLDNVVPIRGLAALCVILTHTGVVPFYKHGLLFVGIFFFFSGYGLMLSLKNKPNYFKIFFKHRLPTILVPYYTMNIFYIIVLFILGFTPTIDRVFRSFFLPMMKGSLFITSAWYVVAIFIFYLFFGLFFRYFRFWKAFFLTTIGVVIYCILCRHFGRSISWYGTTSLFLVGILFAQYYSKIYSLIRNRYYLLSFAVCFLFVVGILIDHESRGLLKFFTHQFSTICFVGILVVLLFKFHVKNPVFLFYGKISYELYIAHHLVVLFLNNSTINPPWKHQVYCLHIESLLLVVLGTIGISTIIALLMYKLNQCIIGNLRNNLLK